MHGSKKLMSISQIAQINFNDNHVVRRSFKHVNNIIQTTFKCATTTSNGYYNLANWITLHRRIPNSCNRGGYLIKTIEVQHKEKHVIRVKGLLCRK